MNFDEAKEMILHSTKSALERTYAECWRQLTPVTEKVKLEKWWLKNRSQFKLKDEVQCEKEYHPLLLTPEQEIMNEEEILFTEASLDLPCQLELF
jgi:hypothetical protein